MKDRRKLIRYKEISMQTYSFLEIKNKTFEDFYLLYCGQQQCTPSYSFGPAVRPNYLIHYVISGKGYYYVNDRKYTIEKNQGFLIRPNELTFYQADEDDPWTYLWIGFDGGKVETYLKYGGLGLGSLTFSCNENELLKHYIDEMLSHDKLSHHNELYLEGLLFLFFAALAKSAEVVYEEDVEFDNLYINKAIEYIQKNYQNPILVTDIANYVSLSRTYLTAIFKQTLHLSPQQFLLKFRITKASELLVNTSLPINAIAHSCGYTDPLAFSKTFRRVTGMSPSDYRNNKLEPYQVRHLNPHEKNKV